MNPWVLINDGTVRVLRGKGLVIEPAIAEQQAEDAFMIHSQEKTLQSATNDSAINQ
jgi:hypothetical protein